MKGAQTFRGAPLKPGTTTKARQSSIAAGNHRIRVIGDRWKKGNECSRPSRSSLARTGKSRLASQIPQPSSFICWRARWHQRQTTEHHWRSLPTDIMISTASYETTSPTASFIARFSIDRHLKRQELPVTSQWTVLVGNGLSGSSSHPKAEGIDSGCAPDGLIRSRGRFPLLTCRFCGRSQDHS